MEDEMTDDRFDEVVDVLVVGSGAGGFSTALAASGRGLDVVLIEKADRYGGSSALSGGGLWIPGAPAQARDGYTPDAEETMRYLRTITRGVVSDDRLRAYVDAGPEMLRFLEGLSSHLRFMWKPGYPDYYPESPGGSAQGSVINIPQIDQRVLGPDADTILRPTGVVPGGMWIAPSELREFYRLRQTWAAKVLFVKLIWRMVWGRLSGARVVTIGEALITRLMLAFRERGLDLRLGTALRELITDAGGDVVGAVVEHAGVMRRIGVRGGVVLASGGFEHDPTMRREYQPEADVDLSLGAATNTGDGIRAAEAVGAGVAQMDSAWWYPCVAWSPGRIQFSLNERMLPSMIIVDSTGRRYINEATPYEEFGIAMIEGGPDGASRIPSWLIIDDWSWRRYTIFGHLPLPRIPFAPAPTGRRPPAFWRESASFAMASTVPDLARRIGVDPGVLGATFERYDRIAATGEDTDFRRGDSVYDQYYSDVTLATPNLLPMHGGPYYAFKLILSDLGTNGGIRTDAAARALRPDGSVLPGLYATGNTTASVMGYSYAGAGATIGPSMTFGWIAANDIADRLEAEGADVASTRRA
jgi:3-oxosteroid 1-dehydrogenase